MGWTWTEILGTAVKTGEGRYIIVHGLPPERPNGGRKSGRKKPVRKSRQKKGKKYCKKCNRPLNSNNRQGVCRECAPRTKVLVD